MPYEDELDAVFPKITKPPTPQIWSVRQRGPYVAPGNRYPQVPVLTGGPVQYSVRQQGPSQQVLAQNRADTTMAAIGRGAPPTSYSVPTGRFSPSGMPQMRTINVPTTGKFAGDVAILPQPVKSGWVSPFPTPRETAIRKSEDVFPVSYTPARITPEALGVGPFTRPPVSGGRGYYIPHNYQGAAGILDTLTGDFLVNGIQVGNLANSGGNYYSNGGYNYGGWGSGGRGTRKSPFSMGLVNWRI